MKAFLKKIKPMYVIIALLILTLLVVLFKSLGTKEGLTMQELKDKMQDLSDKKNDIVAKINVILTELKKTNFNVTGFMGNFQTYFTLFYQSKTQSQQNAYLAVDLTSAGGNNDGKIFRRKTDYTVFRDNSGNIASDEDLIDVGSKDKNNDGWVIVNKQTNNYIRDASGGSASTQIPAVGSTEIVSAYSEPRTVSASQLAAARARVTDQIKLVDNINQVKLLALIDQLEDNLTKSIDVMSTQTTSSLDVFADTGYDPLDYDGLLGTSVTGTSVTGTSGAGTTTTAVTPLDVGASLVGSTLDATAPPAWYTTPPSWWKSTTQPTTMPISSPTYGSLLGADYSLFPVSTSTAGTGTSGAGTSGAGTQDFSTIQGTSGAGTQDFSTSTQGSGTQGTSGAGTTSTQGFSTQGTGTQGTGTQGTGTQGTGTQGTGTPGGIGISKANIPAGQEDLYILKTQAFPQGCPAGGCGTGVSGSNNFRPAPVPPCPPCERCPEPAFSCKKVPNYDSETVKKHLPQPVLASFSQFGM